MAASNLCLHRGAVEVDRHRLSAFAAPPPSGRWYPLPHAQVLETVCVTLQAAGYVIAHERLAVARDGHRFFGTLDLKTELTEGVALAVGIRNSTDKSFPLGFCAGNRVFVCDNLAFRSELLVKRKHTRFGEEKFTQAIAGATQSLRSFQEAERTRIRRLQETALSDDAGSLYVLQALEKGIMSVPSVPRVWKEWRTPSFDFGPPTLWRLLNAFTTVLGARAKTSPNEYAGQTLRLNALLCPGGPFGGATTGGGTASVPPTVASAGG